MIFRLYAMIFMMMFFSGAPLQAAQEAPEGFRDRLQTGIHEFASGRSEEGRAVFEGLLRTNPAEWSVYSLYADGLVTAGDFENAREILMRAQGQPFVAFENRGAEIQHRLEVLEERAAFREAMRAAPAWEEARLLGSQSFALRTNLPSEYAREIGGWMQALVEGVRGELERCLGPSDKAAAYMEALVFGRYEEYLAYARKSGRVGRNQPILNPAYYELDNKRFIVFFDGESDRAKIAHEMVHYLIRDLYMDKPSMLLDEGLAEYVSIRLTAPWDQRFAVERIRRFNWIYDQGWIQDVGDVFNSWSKVLQTHGANPRHPSRRDFYVYASTLIQFLVETGDPEFRSFFQEYLSFEMAGEATVPGVVKAFFRNHLSEDGWARLSDAWIRMFV